MVKNRVVTALCLALGALGCIYLLPPPGLAWVFAAVAMLAAWEWAAFAQFVSTAQRVCYAGAVGAVLVLTHLNPVVWPWVLCIGVAVWCGTIVGILAYPAGGKVWSRRSVAAALGIAVIWSAWVGAVAIRAEPEGDYWLVWLLVLASAVDIGAYFAGKAWGRRKLAPALSPAKTWEGLAGGAVVSALFCAGALAAFGRLTWAWTGLVLLLIGVSAFGDLLESLLKRQSGVKDSGALLPGHGGLLDRIDSTLAALPFFALALLASRPDQALTSIRFGFP